MTKKSVLLVLAMLFCVIAKANECDDMSQTLATMRAKDQAVRERAMSDEVIKEMRAIDEVNTRQLAHLLKVCGWPVARKGDLQASDDIWLLAQHADHDKAFQHHVLALLEQAVHRGEARGKNLAYLTDRLAIAEGKPQLYGTQLMVDGCKIELHPIDSRAAVNERRKKIKGMQSLEEYERAAVDVLLPAECKQAAKLK
ncbi:MAG: hypothetical protein E6Q34_01785 [Burkholderiaceae bacterium]|nr:MAG: hypothetical protein E6Q34_01785 [Burkholderiaceae bacterium]